MAFLHGESFVALPTRFLNSDLSDKALRLLCVLIDFGGRGRVAFPSRETLAGRVGCSTKTIDRLLPELERTGAMTVVKAKRPGGGHPIPHYVLWPADPDRVDVSVQLRMDTGVPTSGHIRPNSEGNTSYKEIDVRELEGLPAARPTNDPVKASAHALAVFAMEQPVKPVIAKLPNAFPAVMRMIETELRAGRPSDAIHRAIETGVDVWTTQGLRTSIAKARPSNRGSQRKEAWDLTMSLIEKGIQEGE